MPRDPDKIDQTAIGLVRVAQIIGNTVAFAAGGVDLSALQLQILTDLLARHEPLTVSFFARRYMVRTATVSDSIRVLNERGLVTKQRDRDDARAVLISITETGREAVQNSSGWMAHLHWLVSGWDDNRRGEILSALVTIIDGLPREGMIPTDRICVACRHFAINCEMGESAAPHYCRFFNTPLRAVDLRIDCPEFESR